MDCKDIEIIKYECVPKTQFVCEKLKRRVENTIKKDCL